MSATVTINPVERSTTPKAHWIVAGAVFIAALIQFFGTVAPTTSFWDCGEFIACSYSLSVPHPPGAPFYLLLGRVFTLFFPADDIGFRVNALSAIVSALTVLLLYLTIVRLIRRWRGPEETALDKVLLYGSGVIGALTFSVSHSFWFNGVEAEVYAISMFFTALVVWLAVRWMDEAETPGAIKYLLLIAYFVGLSIGVHLLNILALSPIVLLIFFHRTKFEKREVMASLGVFVGITIIVLGVCTPQSLPSALITTLGVFALIGAIVMQFLHASKKNKVGMLILFYAGMILPFIGLFIDVLFLFVLFGLGGVVMMGYAGWKMFRAFPFYIAMLVSLLAILIVYPLMVSYLPPFLEGLYNFVSSMAGADIQEGIVLAYLIAVIFILAMIPLVMTILFKKNLLSLIFASLVLVMLGYTTYSIIYIRSNQKPVINENQPDTLPGLISYLNREQYGATGPIEMQEIPRTYDSRLRQTGAIFMRTSPESVLRFNILERKADFWNYQINQMYVRYLLWQFFTGEEGQAYFFPLLLGVFGAIWHFQRDQKRWFVVFMLFLMTGLAIVMYLNQDNPQPRERDYAYVGSYFAFAIWIGMGVLALFEVIEDLLENKSKAAQRNVAVAIAAGALIVSPVNMLIQNWESHDRQGNYVAWDYSRNMLETCDEGGIIFTNGDNDTFPLWYLQVVEGLRPDIRVVNLSLLNTGWYIKQLRDEEPSVPISFTDRFIDDVLTNRADAALWYRYWPESDPRDSTFTRVRSIPGPDGQMMTWEVPAGMYINTGRPSDPPGRPNFLRVQDVMILHILEENRWERPVYFAVTVSSSNLVGLSPFMSMEGLAFKVHPRRVPEIDEPELRDNVFNTYATNYRNLDNEDVHYFPHVQRLLQNYRTGYLQLVYEYYRDFMMRRQRGEVVLPSGIPEEQWDGRFDELAPQEKALYTLRRMEEVMPEDVIPLNNRDILLQLGRIFCDLGAPEEGSRRFDRVLELEPLTIENKIQVALHHLEYAHNNERADAIFEDIDSDRRTTPGQMLDIAQYLNRANSPLLVEHLNRIEQRNDLTLDEQTELAILLLEGDEVQRSRTMLEEMSRNHPDNGTILAALIEVYAAMNDTQNVVTLLEDWVTRNPTDARAQQMLRQWTD